MKKATKDEKVLTYTALELEGTKYMMTARTQTVRSETPKPNETQDTEADHHDRGHVVLEVQGEARGSDKKGTNSKQNTLNAPAL